MKFVVKLISVVGVVGVMSACTHSASQGSSVAKTDPESKPMLGVQTVSGGVAFCVVYRPNTGAVYLGSGDNRELACEQADDWCSRLEGSANGTGACVRSVTFDTFITGIGAVEEQIHPIAGGGYLALAKEMPNAGDGYAQRTWPGIGKTITAAYDDAIRLCTLRGGANCQKFDRPADLSNGTIMPPNN